VAGKPRQFCRHGHDKIAAGILPDGRCRTCRDEKNRNRPKKPETAEQKARRVIRLREWRAKNPEKTREYDRKYYWQDPEKARQESRDYRELHRYDVKKPKTPEQVQHRAQYIKQYRIDNADREKEYRRLRKPIQDAYNKAYYVSNREELLQNCHDYYWNNRDEILVRWRDRYKNDEEYRNKVKARNKVAKHNRREALGKLSTEMFQQVWDSCDGTCSYCLKPASLDTDNPNHWRLEHCTPISRGGTHFLNNLVVSCKTCNNKKYVDTVLEHTYSWKRVTDRYDFFIESKLCKEDKEKLRKLHAKYRI
jgi:hypothetical protein